MNSAYPGNRKYHVREHVISICVHALVITVIFFACNHYSHKIRDLVTISLSHEDLPPPAPGKAGGDGRKAGSAGPDKKASRGTPRTIMRKVAQQTKNMAEKPLKSAADESKKATNVMTAQEISDPTEFTRPIPTSSGSVDSGVYSGVAGTGEGLGGGGGTGIGAYGSGSGFGGRGKGGVGGGTGSGTGSQAEAIKQYLREHYKYIRDLIARHMTYPSMAKKMGWMGDVTVSFVIMETGYAEGVKVVKSSGHSILDENVVSTVKDVQPFPKPPGPARIRIPINYRLDGTKSTNHLETREAGDGAGQS